jgi:hypothetical protein
MYNVFLINLMGLQLIFFNLFSHLLFLSKNKNTLFFSKITFLGDSLGDFSFLEHSTQQRSTRFSNSLISYDYKTGHYLGSSEKYYPYMILSFLEVARGIRKPSWVFSDQYLELLNENYNSYFTNFTGKINIKLSGSEGWYSVHINPTYNAFNFYYIINKNMDYTNTR